MKEIETIHAEGHVICHDITVIIKDEIKDTAFRKGHIVTKEDIPKLLSLGKDHLYVWEKEEGMLHENDAAKILVSVCRNQYMKETPVKEGKIELIAEKEGVFLVDVERLRKINSLDAMMIATRHTNQAVHSGDKLAGTRIIPLVIEAEKMEEVKSIGGDKPLLEIRPYVRQKAAVITTGNEVYHGRIKDTFTPVIKEKLEAYGVEVMFHETVPDDRKKIDEAIRRARESGAELILCTGGMSVDPDDRTPGAIKESGARIVTYGAPVLPGAMLVLGYYEDGTPVLGLPGCVMYAAATVFDLVLPRVLANVEITREEIAELGHGGLCLGCETCHYPACSFGKGY